MCAIGAQIQVGNKQVKRLGENINFFFCETNTMFISLSHTGRTQERNLWQITFSFYAKNLLGPSGWQQLHLCLSPGFSQAKWYQPTADNHLWKSALPVPVKFSLPPPGVASPSVCRDLLAACNLVQHRRKMPPESPQLPTCTSVLGFAPW